MKRLRALCLPTANSVPTPDEVFAALSRDAADHLAVDLTSVWLFDSQRTSLECQAYLDTTEDTVTTGQVLYREDAPTYFQHLLEETVISAARSVDHPWTRELAVSYFLPRGIISTLDFVLHDGEHPVGVVCCESRTTERRWTDTDIQYLRMLTAVASRYFWRAFGRRLV